MFGPDEGLRLSVGLGDEAIDGGLQIDDRFEYAAFQPTARELGEETLDGVRPRARSRSEMEGEARVSGEPFAHLGVLMGSVVVQDHMDELADLHITLDRIEEADELLMPMALHAATENLAFEHVERGR